MTEPYRDHALPIEQRVADLMGRMTLEEKAGQLTQYFHFGSMFADAAAAAGDIPRRARSLLRAASAPLTWWRQRSQPAARAPFCLCVTPRTPTASNASRSTARASVFH